MVMLQTMVTWLYLAFTGAVAALLIWNLVGTRKWQEEALYVLVLIPFVLRIFGLK